jgi:hypothetical protein
VGEQARGNVTVHSGDRRASCTRRSWAASRLRATTSFRGWRRPLASASSGSRPGALCGTRSRCWPGALHSPAGRDVISSQTRRATGGAHRERWRDGPCETAATGEAYRQASWRVPTPAEETPIDESKDLSDEASLHRASAKHRTEGGYS